MKKVYRVSFIFEKHADVINFLEQVPQPFRGKVIAEAIRLYAGKLPQAVSQPTEKAEVKNESNMNLIPQKEKNVELTGEYNIQMQTSEHKEVKSESLNEQNEQKTQKIDLTKIIGGF